MRQQLHHTSPGQDHRITGSTVAGAIPGKEKVDPKAQRLFDRWQAELAPGLTAREFRGLGDVKVEIDGDHLKVTLTTNDTHLRHKLKCRVGHVFGRSAHANFHGKHELLVAPQTG